MMNIVPWNKDLEIGIELIDSQHKAFLKNVNTFAIRVRANKEIEAAKEELNFLQNYLLYHFQAEETFQADCGYSKYLSHQAEHKHLAFKAKEISIKLETENFSSEAIDEFCEFINVWVTGHILKHDLVFAHYYKNYKNTL